MKIVIVMDSFKGSVTSIEAGKAAKKGIEAAYREQSQPEISVLPIADGGEGTIDAIFHRFSEQIQTSTVQGPMLGQTVLAKHGQIAEKVVLEIAETSGITLVEKEKLSPWEATTYGLGEKIKQCIQEGARHFVIGLGGSATNDAGIGMLHALGVRFLDQSGRELGYRLKDLDGLASIDVSQILPELSDCKFVIASDVTNPLCGEQGATAIFGPQKGVKASDQVTIDALLQRFARLTEEATETTMKEEPGAGAAGGVGFAFLSYLQATIVPGFDEIARHLHLEEEIQTSDLVVTGEGLLDAQSLMGKVPVSVARLADKYNKPVIALAGGVSKEARQSNNQGIQAYFPTIQRIASEREILSKETTLAAIEATAEQLFRFAQLFQ